MGDGRLVIGTADRDRVPGSGRRRIPWVTSIATVVVGGTFAMAVLAPWISPFDPELAMPADRLLGFGVDGHLLGTDALGRDVLSRLIHGARLAWVVGVSVSISSLLAGAALGAIAGHFGGWLDAAISRVIDATLAFPAFLLALVLAAIYGPSTTTAIAALSVVYVPLVARVMRATVLSERTLDYVTASRGLGNTELVTLGRHVLRNVVGPMLVVSTVVASRAVIVESSLSFLGAGTQPPTSNWGLMVSDGQEFVLRQPSLVVVPAVMLSVTILAVNTLADAIGDRFGDGRAAGAVTGTTETPGTTGTTDTATASAGTA